MIQPINDMHAILLMEEIKKHPRISDIDTSSFYDEISNINIIDPDAFLEDLKNLNLKIYDSNNEKKFSIGMLLVNNNIDNYYVTKAKHRADKRGLKEGKFPYASIIGDLTFNSDIADMVKNSPAPYSLMGKLETREISQAENYIHKQKIPILIVVGADYNKIINWECRNTINITEPDGGFFKKTRVYMNNPFFNF